MPDELFSKKVPRRSLRAVNQMVIPKGPGPNQVDIPYGAEDLLYGIFFKKKYQYSDSVNSFKNSARTIKADLEAFSINKEASVITMKSKDFIYS